MEQVQKSKQASQETEDVIDETMPSSEADLSATDDLLDEIDSVLEQNAEEFIKGYRQKGGE